MSRRTPPNPSRIRTRLAPALLAPVLAAPVLAAPVLATPVLATLVLATLVLAGGCAPQAPSPLVIGQPIPAFELDRLSGGSLSSQDLVGDQPVVVNFWATWCGPCVQEIPTLMTLHRQGGARVVSIALDREGASVVEPFAANHGIDYPVLLGDLGLFQRYGGVAIPYTLVLDGEMRLVKVFKGLVSDRTLERAIASASSSGG